MPQQTPNDALPRSSHNDPRSPTAAPLLFVPVMAVVMTFSIHDRAPPLRVGCLHIASKEEAREKGYKASTRHMVVQIGIGYLGCAREGL
ncbi:type VI secretion system protein ImpG [Sesbania bispinosa]|nr:type VI secretion system protein ImpG [Sesbania bispinosa]